MPDEELECYHMNQLIKGLNLELDEPYEKSEKPDFLIKLNGKKIGVELTQFFYPPLPGEIEYKHLDSYLNTSIDIARKKFRELGGPTLDVRIYIAHGGPQDKNKAKDLGNRIANLMYENWIHKRIYRDCRELPEIVGISIREATNEFWHGINVSLGSHLTISSDNVLAVINDKIKKINNYRDKCPEIWLAIVNDMFWSVTYNNLSLEAKEHRYSHSFDRLIWVDAHYTSAFFMNSIFVS